MSMLLRSAYNLNDWGPQPDAFRILDLIFAFAYVGRDPGVLGLGVQADIRSDQRVTNAAELF